MKKICKVILAAAAMVALAAPAMAANDKLIVKDSGGSNPAFRVQDNGFVESKNTTTGDVHISDVYVNGTARTWVRSLGIQEWALNSGTAEAGKISYSTPGGGTGIGLTQIAGTNLFSIANVPNGGGAGIPAFAMNFGSASTGYFAMTPTGSAFGYSWTPRTELEVTGTLMINDTPSDGAGFKAPKPTCNATKDGGLFYTVGGAGVASKLELCQKASAGTYSWVLVK